MCYNTAGMRDDAPERNTPRNYRAIIAVVVIVLLVAVATIHSWIVSESLPSGFTSDPQDGHCYQRLSAEIDRPAGWMEIVCPH